MPTLSGLRRRGYTASAIRGFCETIGVANSTVLSIWWCWKIPCGRIKQNRAAGNGCIEAVENIDYQLSENQIEN